MRPAISAHRGGSEVHPAQTHAAFAAAATSGVEYVEFDVRRLGDDALVCYHDDRTSGVALSAQTYGQLCATVGYEVPLVADLLALLAGKVTAHIDLKETGDELRVVELALAALGEDFIVTSLEDASLRAIRTVFPQVRTALSLGRGADGVPLHRLPGMIASELFPARRIRACGASWAAIDKNLAVWGVLRRCADAGIGTMVWTVDDAGRVDRLLRDPRLDVLVTNRPLFALDRRARLHGAPG